ncbi:MAG: hypothetical protein K2O91_06115, partial [Lachnospiraceae bacterium]|nr:hypothetical protein [Lachnospiraceae bacterium]
GDHYIVRSETREKNGGATVQLNAEEIAAVLAETYFGGRVVSGTENEDNMDSSSDEEKEKAEKEREDRRRQRLQEMRRRKKQQEQMRRLMLPCAVAFVVCVILAGFGINRLIRRHRIQQIAQRNEGKNEIVLNEDSSSSIDIDESSSNIDNADIGSSDKNNSDKDNANKDITYASSLNIAGCYIDRTIADSMAEELALAETLVVRTLGGKSREPLLAASADDATALPDSEVVSENVVFIDVEAGYILGQRGARIRIPPASMTKILTVLVAAEHITDADDTFEITQDIINYSFVNRCSSAGFEVGETVTVRDLFYGTVLPSGGEAALGLAVYVAGSQEAFVELMNEKLEELGLSETTHFTNCIGIYDENHYSTVYDIAVILKAAYDNSFCREVLGVRTYTTSVTEQHSEGIDLSNLFLRRIEDKDTHGEVLCAKTGYVDQSGNCAASLGIGNDGKIYICVTAHSNDPWRCIYDHVALYQQFLPN